MRLGEYIGTEKLDIEFKEFCLHQDVRSMYTADEILKILESGTTDERFNQLIFESINSCIELFIPKYLASYINSGLTGIIHIGVNDNGEVTGIPYIGQLSSSKIRNIVDAIVRNQLYTDATFEYTVDVNELQASAQLVKHSEIELQKLKQQCLSQHEAYKAAVDLYNHNKTLWIKQVMKYETKLYNILNNPVTRRELAIFIEKQNKSHCQCHMDTLNSNEIIHVPIESVHILKDKTDSMFYWATRFKDQRLDELLVDRPVKPYRSITLYPDLILKRLSPIRHKLLEKNPDMRYYMITIRVHVESQKHICLIDL